MSLGPAQTVAPLFPSSEHTEASQLGSPVIPPLRHMICTVCNNTHGAGGPVGAAWSGNEMIHGWQRRHTAATYLLLLCCKNNLPFPDVCASACVCVSQDWKTKWGAIAADRRRQDKAIQDLQNFWCTTTCGLWAQVSKQAEVDHPSYNLFLLGLRMCRVCRSSGGSCCTTSHLVL